MNKTYKSKSRVKPEEIAGVLNEFYAENYHLKEILPEYAGVEDKDNLDDTPVHASRQTYTVLVAL
jgi:hypothetical protein